MHKVSQHMQNTITQHHQRREKVTWNHQLHCARSSGTFHGKAATPKTVARTNQLFSATEPPFTQKNTMFRANPNFQIASMIHENEAFVRGILQIPTVEEVKTKLSCEASFEFQQLKRWKRSFRARFPSNSKSWRGENEAFVRGFLRIPRVQDVKTKLSCEAAFKFQQLKRWKRSFRARFPSNSKSWSGENEAFVRGCLQILRGQEVNASFQCSSSNAQSVSTHANHNSTASSKKGKSHLEPSVPLRAQFENILRQSGDA